MYTCVPFNDFARGGQGVGWGESGDCARRVSHVFVKSIPSEAGLYLTVCVVED